jgi:hypothetical protein
MDYMCFFAFYVSKKEKERGRQKCQYERNITFKFIIGEDGNHRIRKRKNQNIVMV